MDREAWWATVRSIAESYTLLKGLSTHACYVKSESVKVFSRSVVAECPHGL